MVFDTWHQRHNLVFVKLKSDARDLQVFPVGAFYWELQRTRSEPFDDVGMVPARSVNVLSGMAQAQGGTTNI